MGAADSKPNGSADAAVAVKSTDPTSSATPPVPAASPFAVAMKAHLLDLLFTAIDSSHVNYLDRTELITFISHEPYLDSPHLKPVVTALLSQLSHDEDSHCSRREWRAVFEPFQPVDITRLLINLIRQLPLPRKRLRHTLCNMEQPPENGAGNHDQQHRMCVYMERMLFLSIDATLNHRINMNELNEFITSDSYFTEHTSEQNAVQSLFTQLRDRKQAPPADGDSGDGGGGDGGGMTQAEFVGIFSGFSLQQVDELFVHLLTRTTHSSLTEAGCASRNAQKPVRHKQMLQDVMRKHVPVHTQEPCRLVHGGEVQRQQPGKPKTFLAMPPSVLPPPHGVRLTLLGQSLIQYDLRETDYGRRVLSSLPPYLTADIVFSELETSISYTNNSDQQQRHTVYQHNAPPVVLDCLKQLGINMLALANNHAGDMGEDGVRVALEEVRKRGFVCAGLGLNEAEATQPTFTTVTPLCWQLKHGPGHTTTDESTDSNSSNSPTLSPTASHSPSTSPPPPPTSPPSPLPAFQSPCPPSVTVALVAHASKIPPGSAATATHAGVNSLSMSDMDTYTLDETDCARILTSTSDARQHASIVIAYQHNHYWSGSGKVNEEHEMGAWKRMWAHALVDSGATVYVSHGDPRLQGIEIYNGCPIFYCLGSFIFQTKTEVGFYGPEVWQSCIVTLEYHSHNTPHSATTATTTQPCDPQRRKAACTAPLPSPTFSIRLTPLTLNESGVTGGEGQEMHWQTRGLPRVAKGEEGRRILEHVAAMSAVFGTVVVVEELEKEEGVAGDDVEGVSVVGWVTGGGVARVGERTDPTVGAEVGRAAGVSKQKNVKAEEKQQADGAIEVK